MMREILVHANLGHEGAILISPVRNLDSRHMCPQAISLMTNRPLQDKEEGPITTKQRQKIKNGRRYATYAVYNTSHKTIILPKNQIMGRCQLILQPNEGAYLQEMSAMCQEGIAEKEIEKDSEPRGADTNEDKEELSREWVMENFRLQNKPILRNNPKVREDLIRVLQKKGQAF